MDSRDGPVPAISKEELLIIYKNFHTVKVSGDAEKLRMQLLQLGRKFLGSVKSSEKFLYFSFYDITNTFLIEKSENTSDGKEIIFKDLQKVIKNLEGYGIRLMKHPWRREFYTIKLFTTYFKHEIESELSDAPSILKLYGYKEKEKSKNIVELKESLDLDRIVCISFELFLSTIELDVLIEMCSEAEIYTDDFTVNDILKARVQGKGDVKESMKYFFKNKGIDRSKRIKMDDEGTMSREKTIKGHKNAAESDEFSKIKNCNHDIFKRDTKYPPTTEGFGSASGYVPGDIKTRVTHLSSSTPIDQLSDADLYGHSNGSPSTKDNYSPMELEETVLGNKRYDHSKYDDMGGASQNGYEVMQQQQYKQVPYYSQTSYTSLPPPPPPPLTYTNYDTGIPPPSYSQATQLPGSDWVMIQSQGGETDLQEQKRPDTTTVLNKTIPGFSAMNIGENGHGIYKNSSETNVDQLSRGSSEVGVRGVNDITSQKQSSSRESVIDKPRELPREPTYDTPRTVYPSSRSVEAVSQRNTKEYNSPVLKEHMKREGRYSDPSTNGFEKDLNVYRSKTPVTRVLDGSRSSERSSSFPSALKPEESHRGRTDLERSTSSGVHDRIPTSKSKDHFLANNPTRKDPKEPSPKDTGNIYTTVSYMIPPSYSKGTETVVTAYLSNKTTSTVTTRSQAREMAAKSGVLNEPYASESKKKSIEKNSKENCIMCNKKATHYCFVCFKMSCKNCIDLIARLSCVDSKEHHNMIERQPTSSHLSSKQQEHSVCSFCGKIASHKCIDCSKKSCGTCYIMYKSDPCSSVNGYHCFIVNRQSQNQTPKKEEATTSKEQSTPPTVKSSVPQGSHINDENNCDFCGLAATLLCKKCLKPTCHTCLHVYEQDLCPPTKREHQFENIVEQPSNTDQAVGKGSDTPWDCERCTFLNSPNNRICAVCATSRGVNRVEFPKSGSRKCAKCTFGNEESATICKMCGSSYGLENPESYI